MKKLLLTIVFGLLTVGAADAARYDNYLSLKLGYTNGEIKKVDTSFDGIGGMFAFGFNHRSADWLYFRSEIEGSYFTMTHKDARISPMGVMLNFYGDFGPRDWLVKPYVGAGFGAKYINMDDVGRDSTFGIAWATMAGITFDMTEDLKLDVGARYDIVSTTDFNLFSIGAMAGVRWMF
ncbi:MAG: acyloxyacyl hydrolase [Alphaproteobacteria bacterium]|nr:acyloxyacyl hydrolase [Alphaproteobacteria bacterium]MCL2889688.1 acyloxyacyl hydrolase [Alphaproteobacteria bacterium]